MTALMKAAIVFFFGAAAVLLMATIIRAMQARARDGMEMFSGAPVTVTYFYMEACPYCQRMKPEWDKFTQLAKAAGITTKEASPDTDSKLVAEKRVSGFPTVLVTVGDKDVMYPSDKDHPRTAEAILAFAKKQA